MILGDVLGAPVYDSDGVRLGQVADARFVVDGAPQQPCWGWWSARTAFRRSSATNGPASASHGRWPGCSGGGTADHS
jgi:hypothetical protein